LSRYFDILGNSMTTVQPKNNARARSGARSSYAARTRKPPQEEKYLIFAVYPQENSKRKKLKV